MENLKKISENIKKSLETLTFPSKLMLKETSSMEKEEICPSLLTREKLTLLTTQNHIFARKARKKGALL